MSTARPSVRGVSMALAAVAASVLTAAPSLAAPAPAPAAVHVASLAGAPTAAPVARTAAFAASVTATLPTVATCQRTAPQLRGQTNSCVKLAQVLLDRQGFGRPLQATGFFGPLTQNAVRTLQTKRHLAVTGRLDVATWRSLATGRNVPYPPPAPTTVPKPVLTSHGWLQPVRISTRTNEFRLEVKQSASQLLVIGANNRLIKQIPMTGNPAVYKPSMCRVAEKRTLNYSDGYTWKLPYFTRLCAGRGIGTHAIPVNARTGAWIMPTSKLGIPAAKSAYKSHGCLRMSSANSQWIFKNVPIGTPVYWR